MNPENENEIIDPGWKTLLLAGAAAALLAGVIFRRNLGVEIELFSSIHSPETVIEWFDLLQINRFIGLAYLNAFDLLHYALAGLVFLALGAALWRWSKSLMLIALTSALVGISVYFASSTVFSLLSLSDQYIHAATAEEQSQLVAAGEALLTANRFSSAGDHPGNGGLISLFLVGAAALITSIVMLRSTNFFRWTAYVGILAASLDLAYCLGYVFVPGIEPDQLALIFIPAAGLLWMIWYILVGWGLFKSGKA